MTRALEFWFEFASTYSYPAAMRIQTDCEAAGLLLLWRPFLLGPVFAAQGLTDSPFNIYPVKGAYMWRDLERICQAQKLGFQKPSAFPRGSLLAARLAASNAQAPWIGDFVRAVYQANFAQDRDIGQDTVLRAILSDLALDADPLIAAASTANAKQILRDNTDAATRHGIFGAPSLRVDGEVFWGNDRIADAIAWAQR